MFPYLIAGAIGYAVAKIFEDDKTPKYSDGGLVVGENDDDNKFPTKEEAFELIQDSIESQGTYFIDEEGDGMFDSEEQAQIYVDEVYDIFDAYYSMEMIPVYRVVEADEVDLDTYSIGESWSMSLDSAKNFGNHLGVSSKKLKIISGYVPSGNVDWESAFKLYVVFSDLGDGDSEFELPIPSNNKIFDVRVSDFKEAKELEPFKFADGGSVLLAPNGKPSNLTPEQYKLVRTPAFKQWFGDWENDRENSGKVSGITKEPVVFYHSTKSNFLSKKGENIFKNPPFFFSFKKDVSDYIVRIQHQNKKGRVYTKPFFLKYHNTFDLRHIKILKDKELTRLIKKHTFYQTESDIRLFELKLSLSKFSGNTWFLTENEDFQDYIKNKGYDSFVVYEDGDKNIAVFNPKQIKLADGTNTTFDGNNPDIRFKNGGELELYHGSEKKFKNFKTNLIDRTDYGWGIYFTDSEDVAKFYARRPFDRDIISQKIIQSKFSTEEKYLLIDTIRLNLLDLEKSKKTLDKKYHPLINQIQKEVQNKSFVYEADVLNEKWLYWDKKVPVDIKRILKNIDDKYFINGETLYNYLTDKLNTQKNASLFLLDKGINGIKYLITNNITDSNIEGYNYVVFDVDDIQIKSISKYADGGQVNFNELIEGYELLLETETDKNKTKIYKEIIEGYELLLDSEFKEPNNNIINEVLWHGSDYDINNFDYNKIIDRSETHLVNFWGYGINFINNENQAKQYGKYLYSVVLSDDADILKGKVKQSQLNKIWDGLIREERIDEKDYEKEKEWFLNHEYSDGDIANDTNEFHSYFLRNKYKLKNSKDVSDFFLRCGIDGMLFDNGIYVIFNDKILNNFKKHYIKGSNSILLAPNGKPSNLTPEQYKLVRSQAFISWFGDWENDPETASKVVDENGEPLVVYHATNNKFWEFSKEKQVVGYYGKGYYFSSSLEVAKDYGKRVIPAFLNIKSVFELSDETPQELLNELAETEVNVIDMGEENTIEQRSKYTFGYASQNSDIFIENLMKSGFYGLRLIYDLEDKIYFFIAFEPNQIKLADGTNTTFDGSNPDIRFDNGGEITTYTEFYDNLQIEDGSKYIGQKFGEVFPFISRTKTPNDYRIILKEYYGIVKRLEEDNYSTKAMKQRDLNKLKSYKINIDKKKYLAGFYLSSNGIITKFVK